MNYKLNNESRTIKDGKSLNETKSTYRTLGNLSWVRTAAQAALALQLHGILETTGYQSASAKLQHASLPKFSKLGALTNSNDDEMGNDGEENQANDETDVDFEEGIICIESKLDDQCALQDNYSGNGFDMLPSPLPISKRSALCAGSALPIKTSTHKSSFNTIETTQFGVRYQDVTSDQGIESVELGDVSVDRDISKLRDIIVSVDVSLSKCLLSYLCVGAETDCKINHQLELLKAIDIGESWRGRMIGQKALLNGIDLLEKQRRDFNFTTCSFVNGE